MLVVTRFSQANIVWFISFGASSAVHSFTLDTIPAAAQWMTTFQLLHTFERRMRQPLDEALRAWHLSHAEFQILWLCRDTRNEGIGQTELSRQLHGSKAQTSGLVESLRCQRLLAGQRSSRDRRRQLWRITDLGYRTLVQILHALDTIVNSGDAQISASDQQQIFRLLTKASLTDFSLQSCPDTELPTDREAG